jgi:glycosyltransferase involved in cell wall biosynthesis
MQETSSRITEKDISSEPHIEEVRRQYTLLRGDVNQPPGISVVIPVYAEGETAENVIRCLASVVRNKPDLQAEVIAVVNGSTEQLQAASELFEKMQEVGIRVVQVAFEPELEKLGKILGARQAGIDAAAADKVIMVDADSVVSPGWIQTYATGLEDHAFAYGPVKIQKTGDPVHDVTASISTVAKTLKRHAGIPPMQGGNHGMNKRLLPSLGITAEAVYAAVRRNEQELAHSHGAQFLGEAWIDTPNGYAQSGKTGLEFLRMYMSNTLQRNFEMIARKAMRGS